MIGRINKLTLAAIAVFALGLGGTGASNAPASANATIQPFIS